MQQEKVAYWLGRMSGHLVQFQEAPSMMTKAALLMSLSEYQDEVSRGLNIPRTVPPPIREAQSFSAWYRRQLDEALAMFQINPSENRMAEMKHHLQGYQDAVAMGRVKR